MTNRFCDWLRAWAVRFCDERALERVVDPLLTDMRMEHADAVRNGQVFRSRWLVVAGVVAFVKAMISWQAKETMPFSRDWSRDDRAGIRRVVFCSAAVVAVFTMLLEAPALGGGPFARHDYLPWNHPEVLIYLAPQALVVAIPLGLMFGVLFGLRGRPTSRRARGAVLFGAALCSISCLVMVAWLVPAANQAFRVVIFVGRDGLPIARGDRELTFSELSQLMQLDGSGTWLQYAIEYHMCWALSFATLALVPFALSVSRRVSSRWTLGSTAIAASFLYYTLMWGGRGAALNQLVSVPIACWSANAAFIVLWLGSLFTTVSGTQNRAPSTRTQHSAPRTQHPDASR